jgi:hypothetical protein
VLPQTLLLCNDASLFLIMSPGATDFLPGPLLHLLTSYNGGTLIFIIFSGLKNALFF